MAQDNYSNFFDDRDKDRNQASRDRVAAGQQKRAERQQQRDIRSFERSQLQAATSSYERRAIKERLIEAGVAEGGIYDISTDSYQPAEGNVAGSDTNMSETGIQSIPRDSRLVSEIRSFLDEATIIFPSIFIFLLDGLILEIPKNNIFAGFNASEDTDWSISIPISNLAYDSSETIEFDDETDLFVLDGEGAQTIARIPIVRGGKLLNQLGAYKEGLICESGDPIVEYYRI